MKNYLFIILGIAYFIGFFYIKGFQENIYNEISGFLYFDYLISIINGIVGIILSFGIINIIQDKLDKLINRIKEKHTNKYIITFFTLLKKLINISKYLISIYIGIKITIIPASFQIFIDKLFGVSFIITILLLGNTLINTFFNEIEEKFLNNGLNKQVFPLLKKVIIAFIWIIGIITIISNLGYDVNALITGAGIGGLAVALASQKTVANIFGAISILINKPFKVGDNIKIGNSTGKVKDLGIVYLKMTDTNGHEILIPNESIISSVVENYSVRDSRKIEFSFGIEYKLTSDKIKKSFELIEAILKRFKTENKISDYEIRFDTFAISGIKIIGSFNVKNIDLTETNKLKEEFNIEVKEIFEKEEINLI